METKAKRRPVNGERVRKATKDEQIKHLQIAYENSEKLRADGNRAHDRQTEELCLVRRVRDQLVQQLEDARSTIVDLKVEGGRMLGYIQRAQEDDMAKSDRKTTQITEPSPLFEGNKLTTTSAPVRKPTEFGHQWKIDSFQNRRPF